MLAAKLVRLIESHADKLSHDLMYKFWNSDRCGDLHKVPVDELKERSYEIYRNLSDWLLTKTEKDIKERYTELGARRAGQGVSFSHFLWAVTATKEHLWEFLDREGFADKAVELFGEIELLHLLDQFFDRALYYAAVGYERERKAQAAQVPGSTSHHR